MPHYEYHDHMDPRLKIIFHKDRLYNRAFMPMHWHKSPEFLFVLNGEISVNCDGIKTVYKQNELAVIGGNQIHEISLVTESATYYCLIIDPSINENIGLLPTKSQNSEIIFLYKKIVNELENEELNYREAAMGYSKAFLTLLSREVVTENKTENNIQKIKFVKKATQYIFENFQKSISLEDICNEIGINKYYLSHIFKEITGKTVVEHLNIVRCINAKSMLKSGKYNVTECCYASGFSNLSYFSKMYKRINGTSPVNDLKSI